MYETWKEWKAEAKINDDDDKKKKRVENKMEEVILFGMQWLVIT